MANEKLHKTRRRVGMTMEGAYRPLHSGAGMATDTQPVHGEYQEKRVVSDQTRETLTE
jgi:hypothetical protein